MRGTRSALSVGLCIAGALAMTSCKKAQPPKPGDTAENCAADEAWIDKSPKLDPSEPKEPTDECAFYQRAWQAYLLAMRPDSAGKAAFLGSTYKEYTALFPGAVAKNFAPGALGLAVRTPEEAGPDFEPGIIQARSDAVIDGNGNPLFYSIEVDPVFTKFIIDNKLNDKAVLTNLGSADPVIQSGSLEIKASWQIVDDPAKFKDYLVMDAKVPRLVQKGDKVGIDPDPAKARSVKVALLGIHMVFVLDNHPEMIWATFEHVDASGRFDVAPAAANVPGSIKPTDVVDNGASGIKYALYKPGGTYGASNLPPTKMTLDDKHQTIAEHSSIYRVFPNSIRPGGDDDPLKEDGDVKSLNANMAKAFKKLGVTDARAHYKLVGAVWLKEGAKVFNGEAPVTDEDLLGEAGLSNMAIESYTQNAEQPEGSTVPAAPHCLSCHVKPGGGVLKKKQIGVSHLFSKFANSH